MTLHQTGDLDGTQLQLVKTERTHAAEIDRTWAQQRRPSDAHHHWKWEQLFQDSTETFCLLELPSHAPVGIWCTKARRVLQLQVGLSYRPDFLELAPLRRGGSLGLFLFTLICGRAIELGCQAMVIASLPEVAPFYANAGGEQTGAHGWNYPKRLTPFLFQRPRLEYLKEFSDAFLVDA